MRTISSARSDKAVLLLRSRLPSPNPICVSSTRNLSKTSSITTSRGLSIMAAQDAARSILRDTFTGRPAEQHIGGWDELWKQAVTPWDRAGPSRALADAIIEKTDVFGSPIKSGPAEAKQRKKALVPGCGRGYDVLLLASLGYDAYGVDGSESAVAAARKLKTEAGTSDTYRVVDEQVGRGQSEFVVNDFFREDFLAETNGGEFDLIFDYTFLCALPPQLRPAWARRMSQLLAPGGHLVCLEWPLHKPPKEGGPPHGLSAELYEALLGKPGEDVQYDEDGKVSASSVGDKAADRLVIVDRYRPSRTHEAGKESDYVSIWKHGHGGSTSVPSAL